MWSCRSGGMAGKIGLFLIQYAMRLIGGRRRRAATTA
jgi:hypothetical protein